eukprot:365285-Chlamydomonas_euryale.AAC.10
MHRRLGDDLKTPQDTNTRTEPQTASFPCLPLMLTEPCAGGGGAAAASTGGVPQPSRHWQRALVQGVGVHTSASGAKCVHAGARSSRRKVALPARTQRCGAGRRKGALPARTLDPRSPPPTLLLCAGCSAHFLAPFIPIGVE